MKNKILKIGLALLVVALMVTSNVFITTNPNLSAKFQNILTIGMSGVAYAETPDYTCDGAEDDIQVQEALDALPATGGKLVLFAGNYDFHATVDRAIGNVCIEGGGYATYVNAGATAVFSDGGQVNWVFKNLRTGTGGITHTGTGSMILGCWINTTYQDDMVYGSRGATIYVYASDALNKPSATVSGLYYVCDGTADQTEINLAIVAASTLGGTVVLSDGHFDITGVINLKSNVSIKGQGKWATILHASADCWVMATTGATEGAPILNIDISGMQFGNGAWGDVTCDGIDLSHGHLIDIHDCAFIQIKGVCVKYLQSFRGKLYNNDFQDCGNTTGTDAVVWLMGNGANAKHCDDIRIVNNDFLMCEYMSIRMTYNQMHIWIVDNYFENDETTPESTYHIGSTDTSSIHRSWILNNLFFFVTTAHIMAGQWTTHNVIDGNYFEGGVQAYVTDTENSAAHVREEITNNRFIDQTGVAVELIRPYYCTVEGNTFKGDAAQYNFYPQRGVGWIFTDNTIQSGLGIDDDTNTGHIVVHNYGYTGAQDVDDTPVDGATTAPISSNWAFDYGTAMGTSLNANDFSLSGSTLRLDRDRNIILTAGGGWATTTAGCAYSTLVESTTNKQNIWYADFDKDTDENMEWSIVLPNDFATDGTATITAQFVWTAASGSGNVTWACQWISYGDNEVIDAAYGTAQSVTDTLQTANYKHVSSATAAITGAGTPAAGEFAQIRVYRDVSEDGLTADARLMSVILTYHGK